MSSAAPVGPPPRLAVAATLVLFALLGVATAAVGAALPTLRGLYHVSAASGSHLVSLYMLGGLIAIVIGGAGERRLHPVTAVTTLTLLFAAGGVVIGIAPNWAVVQIGAVIAGSGFGGLALYMNTAFARAFQGRSLVMLNILNAAYSVGTVVGPIVAGLLTHVGVRLLFLVTGVLAVSCLPGRECGRVLTRGRPAAPAASGRGVVLMKILVPFALISFLYEGLETGTGAWESTHLTWIGFSAAAAAQITACYWAGLLAGRLILPLFTRRLPLPAIVMTGLATAAIALVCASSSVLAPFAYAVAGLGMAPVFPAVVAWIERSAPAPQLANAVMLSVGMSGGVLWPGLIGLVAQPSRPAGISLSLAAIAVLCLAAAWNTARLHEALPADALTAASRG